MGLPNNSIISVGHEKVSTCFQCKFTIQEHLPVWYEKVPSSFHCEFTNEDYWRCGMKRCAPIFSVNSQSNGIFWPESLIHRPRSDHFNNNSWYMEHPLVVRIQVMWVCLFCHSFWHSQFSPKLHKSRCSGAQMLLWGAPGPPKFQVN